MHTKPMSESRGAFTSEALSTRGCKKCGGKVKREIWESGDGAYEDYKFTCLSCGHIFWIDGLDA